MNASTPLSSNNSRVVVDKRKPGRLKFGASSPMSGFLPMLERQPLAELLFKDVFAFNAPKIALARTWKERLDTIPLELSNTSITLFSSLIVPAVLRKGLSWYSKIGDELKEEIPFAKLPKTKLATKLGRMGVSFGFFFPFAAAFWAAPFARNWLTLKRTHTANFESLIGFEGVKSNRPQRSVEEEMDHQKKTAWKVFGVGLALGAASLLSFGTAAKLVKAKAESKLGKELTHFLKNQGKKPLDWLFNNFDLKGEGANQIEGNMAQLIFWGLPAYLGWVHGARSDNERRERFLQSANALFWFFAAPKLTSLMWGKPLLEMAGNKKYWKKEFLDAIEANVPGGKLASKAVKNAAFEDKIKNLKYKDIQYFTRQDKGADQAALVQLKNRKFAISGLAVPITALSFVQLFNFWFTERKITKENQHLSAGTPANKRMTPPSHQSIYHHGGAAYGGNYNHPVFYQGYAYSQPPMAGHSSGRPWTFAAQSVPPKGNYGYHA